MKINLQNVRVTSYTTHSASASARADKTLAVVAPQGTFKQGQRIPKLKLEDAKGQMVAVELAHVVQQKQARPQAGQSASSQEWTLVCEHIQRVV